MSELVCPISGCKGTKASYQLVCVNHWYEVPKRTRDQIWRLYRTEKGSDKQRKVCFDTLKKLNQGAVNIKDLEHG